LCVRSTGEGYKGDLSTIERRGGREALGLGSKQRGEEKENSAYCSRACPQRRERTSLFA